MNLVLHGVEDFRIEQNDTLRNPALTDPAGALATLDCFIANPPFSLKEWGRKVWVVDPWGRVSFGLPPASYGDHAWVQQMVASMAKASGRMAVVLPQGALFREGAKGRIRRALLEQDLIEAVMGLAPNIFYGTGLAPAVVTLRGAKRCGRRGKVIVIDASSLFRNSWQEQRPEGGPRTQHRSRPTGRRVRFHSRGTCASWPAVLDCTFARICMSLVWPKSTGCPATIPATTATLNSLRVRWT